MPAPILLGQSDFVALREAGNLYVDKSAFVAEVLTAPAQVSLHPRPRRFGKTLNLSMLQAWFEIGPDRTALFGDLAIWQDAPSRAHFQRYPVIKLTFKDIKQGTWAEASEVVNRLLSSEVARHEAAVADPRVPAALRERLGAVREGTGRQRGMLIDLCEALFIHHGQKVIVLVDEYDAGILTAWERGYYEEAVDFFRSFLSPGLKDNPYLFRGVLTGILRVARESMFSGLNNIIVYSLLHRRTGEHFGFTEPEAMALLTDFGRGAESEPVRQWYNGYRFGTTMVYNPWSILRFLSEPGADPAPYWLNTSDNALMRSLLLQSTDLREKITILIEGGAIEREIDENVALRDLHGDHVWALLLFAGYLRADAHRVEGGISFVTLSIPNREILLVWTGTFRDWLRVHAGDVEPLHAALFAGEAPRIEAILSRMLLLHASSHDVAHDQDEAFYHAFVLGLLVTLERTHAVRSNREVGYGRADVQLIPKRAGLPGVVLEFKRKHGRKKLATLATEALAQTAERAYTVELEAAGASPIRRIGIAFSGKDVVVRSG